MAIPPTKLTEAFIRSLTYEDTSFLVRDTIIKGLMIAVNKHNKFASKKNVTSAKGIYTRGAPHRQFIVSSRAPPGTLVGWP